MANDSHTQQALAFDPSFQLRVRDALSVVAWVVIDEPATTPGHTQRQTYAMSVIANLQQMAQQISPWLVNRTNIEAGTTSYDFPSKSVVTTATDADIQSQLSTDWNSLCGFAP
jgi:hypothetical protein